ncbi:MAG: NTP transferase domain-containing protein [Elusimicrobiales bacterium]|jgi:NDP-sugar pyrophosphorylase family protein
MAEERVTVCILTAGKGVRMGAYSKIINKALLPVRQKAVISYIIEKFPENSEYVVALGYLGEQVRSYLELAHGDRRIRFVEVDNWDKPGSGPGYSMLCCKPFLHRPFYFVSCDTLWNGDVQLREGGNWLGVSETSREDSLRYCNLKIDGDGGITGILDKETAEWPPYKAFVGLMRVQDHDIFWEGLGAKDLIKGELQVSNGLRALIKTGRTKALNIDWTDIGNEDDYKDLVKKHENFDFSKTNEFLYLVNNKVIKFFGDGAIAEKRVAKSRLKPGVFPTIEALKGQFYSYGLVAGGTLYDYNDGTIFKKLLDWLKTDLWTPAGISAETVHQTCRRFYYDKTRDRLELFYKRCAIGDGATVVNGRKIAPTGELLERVPWEELFSGVPVFFHGDLQFDNILYSREKGRFTLLDWRQDFGGNVEWGDLYYDLAKLYGGILLNYDFIKRNLLYYHEGEGGVTIDFAQRFLAADYIGILEDFVVRNNWEIKKVRMLVPLIYLNMSPLHHEPFNRFLYSLGRLMLSRELGYEDR